MSEEKRNGRLIVFEGIDGAGKTTQIHLLNERLAKANRRVYCTAEPTESVSGGMLRDALGGIVKRSPCEMTALFVLDRIFHNVNPVNGIQKFLAEGVDVICDRYYYSTLAYQGGETDPDWVKRMNLDCPEIRRPDVCIFLDLTPEESMARISHGRMTTEIYENREKLQSVRDAFFRMFKDLDDRENIVVVKANRTPEEIADEIYGIIEKL